MTGRAIATLLAERAAALLEKIAEAEGWNPSRLVAVAIRLLLDMSPAAMRDHMRTKLPLAALMMATQRQRPAEDLICVSDRGSNMHRRRTQPARRHESETVNEPHGLPLR